MAGKSDSETGTTLFALLRDNSEQAWKGFVDRYGPRIYQWCCGLGAQPADAENVTQEVLLKLYRKLRETYDPAKAKFRSWLKEVTKNAWRDYLDSQKRPGAMAAGGSAVIEMLSEAVAGADLWDALGAAFDLELLEEAKSRVSVLVSERDWEIFQELAFQGRSGAEVAAERGMAVATVFMVRSRVQQKLRDTVQALENGGPDAADSV
jgi:RNA polymerase sigma-70 factor (ECF subfamily)